MKLTRKALSDFENPKLPLFEKATIIVYEEKRLSEKIIRSNLFTCMYIL